MTDIRHLVDPTKDWVIAAHNEAADFARPIWLIYWGQTALWAAVIAGATWYHMALGWILLILFVAICSTIALLAASYLRKLDVRCSYLEQCCTQIHSDAFYIRSKIGDA